MATRKTKKGGNGLLIFGLLAGASYAAYSAFEHYTNTIKDSVNNITIAVARVKIKSSIEQILDLKNITLTMEVHFSNPSDIPHTIESLVGHVGYEGLKISDFEILKPFTIEPHKITPVILEMKVQTKTVLDKLANIVLLGQKPSPVQVLGTVKVQAMNGKTFAIDQTISLQTS